MFEFLIIAWVAWQFTNLLFQDGIHAIKGTTPPRHVERMTRLARGEDVPQRYGVTGYLKDLLDDALRADVERRRRKREEKDATEGGPVPDPTTAAPPTGTGRPEEPVAATVPDPAAPVEGTEPEGPSSSVVHTDDHSYCPSDDCRTETDRHTDDGPPCPLHCGGRIVGHRTSHRDSQVKDLLCSRCGWLVKKPPTAPSQPQEPTPTDADETSPASQPQTTVDADGEVEDEDWDKFRRDNQEMRQRGYEMFGRCMFPMTERPHGMCGDPAEEDSEHGGWEGNPYCSYHTSLVKQRNAPFWWQCRACHVTRHGFRTQDDAEADSARHKCATSGPSQPTGDPPASTDSHDQSLAPVIPFPTQPGVDAGTNAEGATMTDTTNPSGVTEVTGMASAVAYAKGVSAAHAAHGDGESFVGSLANFEVGASDIDKVRAAQEASRNAAALWQTAADALHNHNMGVREAYAAAPDAGNRQFATSE